MSEISYWDVHGIICGLGLGLMLAVFPRLTTLILVLATSMTSGGVFWWVGWIICPHILVAGLATLKYWDTNPFLVIFAWIIALAGTGAEAHTVSPRRKRDD